MSVTSEEFSPTIGTYQEGRNMLYERITDAWRDMRASTRRLILEQPSEARLLFYVLMSDMIFFLSWSLKTVVSPDAQAIDRVPFDIAFWLVIALFMRTSLMYLFSIVLGSCLRLMGGQASWRDTRTAVFWGALVAAPFGFLLAIVSVVFKALEPVLPVLGEDVIRILPYWISIMPFLWYISAGLAEAHGFRDATRVFVCLTGVSMIFVLGLMLAISAVF